MDGAAVAELEGVHGGVAGEEVEEGGVQGGVVHGDGLPWGEEGGAGGGQKAVSAWRKLGGMYTEF